MNKSQDRWEVGTGLVSMKPYYFDVASTYVTGSGKTGLMANLKVSRNNGFKYLKCCSSPMVLATCTKFSHIIEQCITLN